MKLFSLPSELFAKPLPKKYKGTGGFGRGKVRHATVSPEATMRYLQDCTPLVTAPLQVEVRSTLRKSHSGCKPTTPRPWGGSGQRAVRMEFLEMLLRLVSSGEKRRRPSTRVLGNSMILLAEAPTPGGVLSFQWMGDWLRRESVKVACVAFS